MKRNITTLIFILSVTFLYAFPGKVQKSFDTPGQFATGMSFDGKKLWIADRKTDKLYCIDPTNGRVERTIPAPAYWPMGLAFDGKYLWNADVKGGIPLAENYNGVIYKINPKDGTILHRLPSPTPVPRGLTWDGKYLWVLDDSKNKLIQFDSEDGTTIKEFDSPAGMPSGLTFDGKYLWVADRGANEIYMVDPTNGKVLMILDAPGGYAFGLAYDGDFLWNVDRNKNKIFQLIIHDDDFFVKKNPRESIVTYVHLTTNFGPGNIKTADIYLSIPENRVNQKILKKITYSETPEILTDKWGQKVARFHKNNISQGQQYEVAETINVETFDVRYFIFPDKVGTLSDIPQEVKKFLANDVKYEYDNVVIKNAVKEAVGDEKNAYWIARKIYDYLMPRMYYEMTGGWNTAPTVLSRGNGSCSEYSFVYIAMCRAAGLPARYVGSIAWRGEKKAMDDVFHRWVEVYLPNYGWIPVDPSGGDQKYPAAQARYFGHLSNHFLITTQSGGGSEYMEWTYNSNENYTSEPKTYIVHEYFADWHALEPK
ncbi:MAG TPA: transglutaminase [Bacteroidales bacterium]|nr:transglutaminase [Bacteroidales bacterium]